MTHEEMVRESLARIETRIGEVSDRVQAVDDKVGDLRERVAKVEVRSGAVATVISAFVAAVAVLAGRQS